MEKQSNNWSGRAQRQMDEMLLKLLKDSPLNDVMDMAELAVRVRNDRVGSEHPDDRILQSLRKYVLMLSHHGYRLTEGEHLVITLKERAGAARALAKEFVSRVTQRYVDALHLDAPQGASFKATEAANDNAQARAAMMRALFGLNTMDMKEKWGNPDKQQDQRTMFAALKPELEAFGDFVGNGILTVLQQRMVGRAAG